MSKEPIISVHMTVYNTVSYLAETIESILNQTYKDFEFLIIDDGSTDESPSILRRYADQDQRIRLWMQPNQGITKSRNQLLERASGDYIAVMDSDDVAMPERFAHQIAYLQSHPECVVVGSRAEIIDPEGDSLSVWYNETQHDVLVRMLTEGKGDSLCHPSVMMRRAAVIEAGGYNQDHQICVDLDLFLRMSHLGKLTNLPETLLKYRMHLGSISHRQPHRQMAAAREMGMAERKRQGISETSVESVKVPPKKPPAWIVYYKWGWWALGHKNVKVARKYAVRSIANSPFSYPSWKLLFCALRGH